MIRGEIWWASLPKPRGSEPSKTRPVVILQSDAFNKSKISTVICAVIRSNLELAKSPGNILLKRADSKLEKPSVINISQIVTLDKQHLVRKVSMLSSILSSQINKSIQLILDLTNIL